MFINIGISHFITAASEILIGITITAIWAASVILKVSLDWQLYIVILSAIIFVWGTYAFLKYNAKRHTTFLHKIIGYSIRAHLGRTSWWKAITAWLDTPGDYSNVSFENTQDVSEHINSISATNHKEEDMKRILEYIKGKAEVYVSDISENSGAERLRVYPILTLDVVAKAISVMNNETSLKSLIDLGNYDGN